MSKLSDDLEVRRGTEEPVPTEGAGSSGAGAFERFRRVATVIAIADALCLVSAVMLVAALRHLPIDRAIVAVLLVAPFVWVAVLHAFGLYGVQHLPAPEELRRLISAVTLGVFVILFTTLWWDASLDRATLGSLWFFALVLELVVRRVARWYIRRQKRARRLAFRTVVVGTNPEAARIARAIEEPVRGFVPLGFIAVSEDGVAPVGRILGRISDLESAIREHGAECVFVAATAVSGTEMMAVSQACRRADVEMRVSANLPDILTTRLSVQQIHDDVMAVAVRPVRLTGSQAVAKRAFDLVIAAAALLLFLPIVVLIGGLIMLTSPGPALFRQQRITRGGRPFTVYKFRTMVKDPDRALEGKLIDLTQPFFKLRDDPRLTPIGRILRTLSLDELPQLWNIVRGDMSIVGPRPLPADQVAANEGLLAPRHEVRAGLTGWWQISGRSEVDVEEALRMDLFYIENWSLTLDLYIVLKTAGAVIARRGAY